MVNQADAAAARQFFHHNGPMGIIPLQTSSPVAASTPPMMASGSATPNVEFERWQEQFRANSASFQDAMKPPGVTNSAWAAELERFKAVPSASPMQTMPFSKQHCYRIYYLLPSIS